jgi:chromosome segregation ATPase
MAEKKGLKTKLEDGGKSLKYPGDKIKKTKKAFDDSVKKVTSPFDQKKKELNAAMNKAEEPFNVLKTKQQQAKNTMDQAEKKTEAAKKILNAKEILHKEGKDRTNKVMNDARSSAQKAKSSIEDRQKEFTKAGEFFKSLIAKLGSQGKAKSSTGGKI